MATPRSSSHVKLLALFDLFTVERPIWYADEICAALGYSRPTVYRYLGDLVDFGLLHRVATNGYALGPRIIVLDHVIRHGDPVLAIAVPAMRELARQTQCDVMMSALYGDHVIDVHHERYGAEPVYPLDARGRIRPPLRGSASKVIVANLPKARQRALYDRFAAAAQAEGIGATWDAARARFQAIRKAGHYVSDGELVASICSISVPLIGHDRNELWSINLVARRERFVLLDLTLVKTLVTQAAARIALMLEQRFSEDGAGHD